MFYIYLLFNAVSLDFISILSFWKRFLQATIIHIPQREYQNDSRGLLCIILTESLFEINQSADRICKDWLNANHIYLVLNKINEQYK